MARLAAGDRQILDPDLITLNTRIDYITAFIKQSETLSTALYERSPYGDSFAELHKRFSSTCQAMIERFANEVTQDLEQWNAKPESKMLVTTSEPT